MTQLRKRLGNSAVDALAVMLIVVPITALCIAAAVPVSKISNYFLRSADPAVTLQLCPSSSNLCLACYKHARLTGCTDCDYLVDAERLSDGSIRCTWATLPFLKTQR